MPKPISSDEPVPSLRYEYTFTETKLSAPERVGISYDVPVAGFLPGWREFLTKLDTSEVIEKVLEDEINQAEALIYFVDELLNALALQVAKDTRAPTPSQPTPVYDQLFPETYPSKFIRPILGDQLEGMRKWVPILKGLSDLRLSAHGARLEKLIAAADAAVKALEEAKRKKEHFFSFGARAELVKEFNSRRQALHAGLEQIRLNRPLDNPLPENFADQYFYQETPGSLPTLETQIRKTTEKISAKTRDLASLHERLELLNAEKARLEAEEDEEQKTRAEISERRRRAEEELRVARELEKKIKKRR